MEVLFLILKIIGICLLVLIGLFLFLILSIVFIPVRYRIRGKGEIPEAFKADVMFCWFLRIFYGKIQYGEEGIHFRIRIFGIPLRFGKKKPIKEKKKKRKRGKVSDKKDGIKETEISKEPEPLKESEVLGKAEPIEKKEDFRETESIKEHSNRFKRKFDKLKWKFQNLKRKIVQLKEQLSNIKTIISEETNRNAMVALFQEFKYLMKHYSPRKAYGELQFGTEDPANTGQILGIISMFPFWYRYKISVIPDFTAESFYGKGKLSMKGHIRSIHLLVSGIRLIKNKDIRKLINQIRK